MIGVFFTFPIEATRDNWLSDCLREELLSCLRALDTGRELPAFLADAQEEYRAIVERFTGIGERFRALVDVVSRLSAYERSILRDAVKTQNDIPAILDGVSNCVKTNDSLPEAHDYAKELFRFCFGRLASIKSPRCTVTIRDAHYQLICEGITARCCPFCGMGRLDAYHPDIPREDLDHYLAVSKYPFAGVNLRNLTPMCERCNSSYKRARDVLYRDDGKRTACLFPYGDDVIRLDVRNSQFVDGEVGKFAWIVDLCPDTIEANNWDRVFQIKSRYTETVLKVEYKGWLIQIGEYLRRTGCNLSLREDITQGLGRFRQICHYESLPGIAQVKEAVVGLLIAKLQDEVVGERVQRFLEEVWSV